MNRYWVGNGGNWGDTAHWSASSGGAGGASVPGTGDFAYIDNSSISTTGQTISLSGTIVVGSINITGQNQNPTIDFGSSTVTADSTTGDYGSIDIESNSSVTVDFGTSIINFTSADAGAGLIIDDGSQISAGSATFNFNGAVGILGGIGSFWSSLLTLGTVNINASISILQSAGLLSITSLTIAPSVTAYFYGDGSTTTVTVTTLNANGSANSHIYLRLYPPVGSTPYKISATNTSLSYVDVSDCATLGSASPFQNANGVDSGNNTGWDFLDRPTTGVGFFLDPI